VVERGESENEIELFVCEWSVARLAGPVTIQPSLEEPYPFFGRQQRVWRKLAGVDLTLGVQALQHQTRPSVTRAEL
jgi:hypothetical protein